MKNSIWTRFAVTIGLGVVCLAGCNSSTPTTTDGTSGEGKPATGTSAKLSGSIKIDGSSTVYPISAEVAENFQTVHPDVTISVSESGTGGGMKKFIAGEIDICNASRPISEDELKKAGEAGQEFIEIPVAYDGITIVVNPKNTWVDNLTVEELKKIWEPESKVKTWADVRAGWPNFPIKLYGPGTASGTFDFFTKVIVKKEKASRTDFQSSEDDNVLVQGVAGDKDALGYFGIAYFEQNANKLKGVPIVNDKGVAVAPNAENVKSLQYRPLSRPEFIYVNKKVATRPDVVAFIEYYLGAEGQKSVTNTGYVAFDAATYEAILANFKSGKTGSLFQGKTGMSVDEVLKSAGK